MKRALLILCLLAGVFAISLVAQGPLRPLMELGARTDASGYLITTGAAYTAPDGPLTAMGNLRGRTDANGYLLVTNSPTGTANRFYAADGLVGTPSYTYSSETGLGLFRPGAGYIAFAELGNMDWASGGTNFILQSGGAIGFSSTTNPYSGSFDTKIMRAAAGQFTYTATTFATLGTPANGTATYCSDCTVTTAASCPATPASCICAGAGTGAFAYRLNGTWDCVVRQ